MNTLDWFAIMTIVLLTFAPPLVAVLVLLVRGVWTAQDLADAAEFEAMLNPGVRT